MRKSLKTQIAVLFIGLIGFVFLANWCTNNFLLERYYVAKKEAALQRIYDNMNKVEDVDDYLMDDFENTLSEYCTRYKVCKRYPDNASPPPRIAASLWNRKLSETGTSGTALGLSDGD